MEEDIIRFYRDEFVPKAKRRISIIWKWDDEKLEDEHDYIQWLFPLKIKSRFNPNAPLLTTRSIEIFQSDPEIRKSLIKSVDVIMSFFGWKIIDSENNIVERLPKKMEWLEHPHNFDRISRILSSLHILGFDDLCLAVFLAMCKTASRHKKIVQQSFIKYWLPTQKYWLPMKYIKGYNIDLVKEEKSSPEKKSPEKKSPEKKSPEKKSPEKKSPEKKSPEKKSPEKKESEEELKTRKKKEHMTEVIRCLSKKKI